MDEKLVELLLREDLSLQRQQEKLVALRLGAFCFHRSFGFGEVVGYDDEKRRLLVDFAGKPGHAIDPAFAAKHLEVLPEDHILVRFRRDASATKTLVQEDPAAAIRLMLAHSPDHRAIQGEMNVLLTPILGEGALKAWWTRAKKLAESDPCIAQPESRTGYYALREQPREQLDELIDGVLLSKQAAKKIQCAAKILTAKKLEEQREKLLPILEELEGLSNGGTVSDGERLQLLWLCEDFSDVLHCAVPESLSLTSLLQSVQDLTTVADSLSATQLNRLLVGIKHIHPEEYGTLCIHLLRSGSSRTIGATIDFLLSHGHGEEVVESLGQWLRDNTLRAPLLGWILRNRHQKKYMSLLTPFITTSLFRLALVSIDQEALRRSTKRKIALEETIAEDKLLVEEVTLNQSQEAVRDLANMVLHSQAFDTLTKKSIVARFIRLFPALQGLLDGEGGGREETVLRVSQASLDAIRNEYETLVQQKIPANRQAVEIAREHGDLRENSEYKMARQDQDMLLARKAQIEKDLARARVVDFQAIGTDSVAVGSVVTLADGLEQREKFAILGAWDSEPKRRILAYQTPFGRALLGKKVGETVAIEGQPPRRVIAIERWADCASSW